MNKYLAYSLFLMLILFNSCGPKVYKTPDFSNATQSHKVVAILPPSVFMQLRPNEAKRMTPEEIQSLTDATSKAIQEKLYGWFLRRDSKEAYTVAFQDVSKTNALLNNAGLNNKEVHKKTKSELAQLLGVDAVISTDLRINKPMSEGVAVAVGIAFGVWGNTNNAFTTINIHDGKSSDLLWKYDYEAAGSIGSSPERLVNALMKNASKKFPYNTKS